MVKTCVIVVCSAIDCTLDDRRFYDVVVSVHGNPTLGRQLIVIIIVIIINRLDIFI